MRRPSVLLVAVLTAAAVLGPAAAATAFDGESTATGHDVSYPQCGSPLPLREDIAVVGVNAGTGTTTNPCLAEQLAWADAPAAGGQERLGDVYVNTANPGHLADWWPAADLTPAGLPVPNHYGSCRGAEDSACGYVYGWSIATDDVLRRGVTRPVERTWWLDVETVNTWSWDRAANRAVLEGMADAIRRTGARVGLYSTARQWRLIAGTVPASSPLVGLPAWLSGSITQAGAEAACAGPPLTPGGRVERAQWVSGSVDRDTACSPGLAGTTPTLSGDARVGGRLTAAPGPWSPAGIGLRFPWLRDGVPIAGAGGPAYDPVPADEGAGLAVRVSAAGDGVPDLALTSAAGPVGPPTPPPDPEEPRPASPVR